ncbi:hypothetical protein HWI79_2108 [Cryptosporidium felis]|nr:hypothetical protein HWI79_2108 [Cryptosporidium felis]
MAFNPYILSKIAVFIFIALFLLLKNGVSAINQLDLIFCGRKGNQFYVTSTPFITRGAYLYADLLIKAIEGPWPTWQNGTAYTRDEYKLAVVRDVILTSPVRLRLAVSRVAPPQDNAWTNIIMKMKKYPKALRIINDIRFSVFLCGPDMLDTPILTRFIEKLNGKYGYNFSPFSDKIIIAALKMHGVKQSEIERKLVLSKQKSPTKREGRKQTGSIHKSISDTVNKADRPSLTHSSKVIHETEPRTPKPLILNESEFEEFKDEKLFESEYSKTPPFMEEEYRSTVTPNPNIQIEELPEKEVGPITSFQSISAPSEKPGKSETRVSKINRSRYNLNLDPVFSRSQETTPLSLNKTIQEPFMRETLQEDITNLNHSDGLESQGTGVEGLAEGEQIEIQPTLFSPNIELENKILESDSKSNGSPNLEKKVTTEYGPTLKIGPPKDHEPLDLNLFDFNLSDNRKELQDDINNYTEQEETDTRIKDSDIEDEDEDDDDDDEEDDFMSEEEYNQYLDYKDHRSTNKEEMEDYILQRPEKSKAFIANYPLGKEGPTQKALLQDVSSVFGDLLNAVRSNKISEKNAAFGLPSMNLRLNTRSKAIVIGDRIIKKWKAQYVDGVLKRIPIFYQGSFEEFSETLEDFQPSDNSTSKEPTFIEIDFDSALKSHDKNEGGYIWIQRNLVATRTTSGFQDVLIKAAIKGLRTLTSIQCSSILRRAVTSIEVSECIRTYLGSINYGQNIVYGPLVEDEERTIDGFEIDSLQYNHESSETGLPEIEDSADRLIRKHLEASIRSIERGKGSSSLSEIEVADKNIRKYLENETGQNIPIESLNDESADKLFGFSSKDKRSQFSENSEDSSESPNENSSKQTFEKLFYDSEDSAVDKKISVSETPVNGIETQNRIDEKFEDGLQEESVSDFETSPPVENHRNLPAPHKGVDYKNPKVPNEYEDPEFIDSALEKLAYRVTEAYKKISGTIKTTSSDIVTLAATYLEFLDTLELWTAIAGEVLKYCGTKIKSSPTTKKIKLQYFYSREEFYIYQAIFTYTNNLVHSMNLFLELRKMLEEVRELLRKSLSSRITYDPIRSLSTHFEATLEQFNLTYDHNLQTFCGGLSITDCLGIMRNDFYRRNEKFSGFLSRNSNIRKAIGQILELFDVKVSDKSEFSFEWGKRDDINRYLIIKEYISKQIPIFDKGFKKELLSGQLKIDMEHANYAIRTLLEKHGLVSKSTGCCNVEWRSNTSENSGSPKPTSKL